MQASVPKSKGSSSPNKILESVLDLKYTWPRGNGGHKGPTEDESALEDILNELFENKDVWPRGNGGSSGPSRENNEMSESKED